MYFYFGYAILLYFAFILFPWWFSHGLARATGGYYIKPCRRIIALQCCLNFSYMTRISCLYSYIPSLLNLPPPPPPKLSPSWNAILFIHLVHKTWCQHALLECSHLFWGKFSSSPGVPEGHSSWSPPHGILVNPDSLVGLLITSSSSPSFFVRAVLLRLGGKGDRNTLFFSLLICDASQHCSRIIQPQISLLLEVSRNISEKWTNQ